MLPFHSRSKLASLTPSQKDQVASWMLDEGLSQCEAAKRVQEVFGFTVCHQTVSTFWRRECIPRKLLRSAETAKSVQALAVTLKTDWQDANAQLIGQKIFDSLSNPDTDLKSVCMLGAVLEKVKTRGLHEKALRAKLVGEKKRFEQKERQMALAREKFEFDAVEEVLKQAEKIKTISTDRALSSDEKREQLRRLLFPQAFEGSPA